MSRIAVVLLLAVLALAACGGHDTLTKAQVISKGTTICKHAEAEVNALPPLTTQHPFARGTSAGERRRARAWLVGYARALDHSRNGLAALDAPKDSRSLLDAYFAGVGQVADDLRAAAKAPDPQVEPMVGKAFALFDRISADTARYGFAKGVCASGAS